MLLDDGSSIWWYTEIDNNNDLMNYNQSRLHNQILQM